MKGVETIGLIEKNPMRVIKKTKLYDKHGGMGCEKINGGPVKMVRMLSVVVDNSSDKELMERKRKYGKLARHKSKH